MHHNPLSPLLFSLIICILISTIITFDAIINIVVITSVAIVVIIITDKVVAPLPSVRNEKTIGTIKSQNQYGTVS
jgi:hypothetical protein